MKKAKQTTYAKYVSELDKILSEMTYQMAVLASQLGQSEEKDKSINRLFAKIVNDAIRIARTTISEGGVAPLQLKELRVSQKDFDKVEKLGKDEDEETERERRNRLFTGYDSLKKTSQGHY